MNGLFDLSGTLALVTGCSRGIGQAMALGLAEAGADIIGVSSSLPPQAGATQLAVEALGRCFYPYACDLGAREQVRDFCARVLRDHPKIDCLINNAGVLRRAPAEQHPDEDWDQVIEINLNAPFLLTREIGRAMLANGRGKIIFTASLLSFQGGILVPGYAASKGGVAQLVKALANEWAARGVNVNAIAPGYIRTDINTALQQDESRNAAIVERIPAGRWGLPDDLKGATVFLASRASDYVDGIVLPVDGGWLGR